MNPVISIAAIVMGINALISIYCIGEAMAERDGGKATGSALMGTLSGISFILLLLEIGKALP